MLWMMYNTVRFVFVPLHIFGILDLLHIYFTFENFALSTKSKSYFSLEEEKNKHASMIDIDLCSRFLFRGHVLKCVNTFTTHGGFTVEHVFCNYKGIKFCHNLKRKPLQLEVSQCFFESIYFFCQAKTGNTMTGWWFQIVSTIFYFPPIWGRFPY